MPRPPAPEVRPVSTGPSMGLIGAVVALVVALVAVLVWWATRGDGLDAQGSSSTLAEGGGVGVGPGAGADVPQVQVYEDFQCPWCGVLERSVGAELTDRATAGELNVTFTIMSFLDGSLRNDSSSRAANAALCADDAGAFVGFHEAAYAQQPEEGVGYTDETLVGLAEGAGVEGAALDTFRSCVADRPHAAYVEAMQRRANQDGVQSTPTVTVNGQQISAEEMSGLMQDPSTLDAVLAAHPPAEGDGAATSDH